MVFDFFFNYETTKLHAQAPQTANLIIFLALLLIIVFTSKKQESQFLDRIQTEQLKGLAIIFVIIGHFWILVSASQPSVVLSGDAVALFFMLSGYGLTQSWMKKPLDFRSYLQKRVKKVLIPYWATTVIILLLDYLLLFRTYELRDVVSTFAGVNINRTTQNFDYVRWYITFLLIWYFLFYFAMSKMKGNRAVFFLLCCSVIIFPLDYYVTHFRFYQYFAFPLGCLVGYNKEYVSNLLKRNSSGAIISALFFLCVVVVYKSFFEISLLDILPSIICKAIKETVSVLFVLAAVLVFTYLGYCNVFSTFLLTFGALSYELFLLHGVFLIKYNPVGFSENPYYLCMQFGLYFLLISLLSFIFKKTFSLINS